MRQYAADSSGFLTQQSCQTLGAQRQQSRFRSQNGKTHNWTRCCSPVWQICRTDPAFGQMRLMVNSVICRKSPAGACSLWLIMEMRARMLSAESHGKFVRHFARRWRKPESSDLAAHRLTLIMCAFSIHQWPSDYPGINKAAGYSRRLRANAGRVAFQSGRAAIVGGNAKNSPACCLPVIGDDCGNHAIEAGLTGLGSEYHESDAKDRSGPRR